MSRTYGSVTATVRERRASRASSDDDLLDSDVSDDDLLDEDLLGDDLSADDLLEAGGRYAAMWARQSSEDGETEASAA